MLTDDNGNIISSGGEFSSTETSTFRIGESLNLNYFSKENFQLYPNPSNGLYIIKNNSSSGYYSIYNLMGQIIKNGNIYNGKNSIDIRNNEDGVYFISIHSIDGNEVGFKLIKN